MIRTHFQKVSSVALGFLLIVFGQGIPFMVISAILRELNVTLSIFQIVVILQLLPYLGLVIQVIGFFVCLLSFRIKPNKNVKQQWKPLMTIVLSFLLLVSSMAVFTPIVRSNMIATGSYYLDVPLPIADYYVGKFTNSTFFMVDGKTWQLKQKGADPAVVVNYAISNASSDGYGKVLLGSGTYQMTSSNPTIILRNNVWLQGMGRYVTKIIAYSGMTTLTGVLQNQYFATGGSINANITVSDLGIVGQRMSMTGLASAIAVDGVKDTRFERLYLEGFPMHGIRVRADIHDNWYVTIDDVKGYWFGYNLMVFGGYTNTHTYYSVVKNSWAEYTDTGYSSWSGTGNQFLNNWAINNTNTALFTNSIGFAIEGPSGGAVKGKYMLISNNYVVGGNAGIEVVADRGDEYVQISNNFLINQTGVAAISIGGGSNRNMTIQSNMIDGGGTADRGVYVLDDSVTVKYNTIINYQNYGIDLLGNNDTAIGNTLQSSATNYAFRVSGDYAVIQANYIYQTGGGFLNVVTGADRTVFENNIIGDGGLTDSGTNTLIRWNTNYKTEGGGTATISSSTAVTFSHGLTATPVFVSVSFNAIGWGSWRWSASSTEITVTVETSGTYLVYWEARTWNYP